MTPLQLVFLAVAAMTLISALLVVTRRNMVHAALFLVVALFGVAVFFVMLNAGFLAVVQVLIYIGAIAILMIFAVMLTRRITSDEIEPANRNAGWAAMLASLLFFSLVILMGGWSQFNAQAPKILASYADPATLGEALVSPQGYVIPFEVASVLLLAALIGSIVIAWQSQKAGE